MSAKHTPGPWRHDYISSSSQPSGWTNIHGDPDKDGWTLLAKVHTASDARLIAAAPDMLAALRKISNMDGRDDLTSAWTIARTAIAKAIGEQP